MGDVGEIFQKYEDAHQMALQQRYIQVTHLLAFFFFFLFASFSSSFFMCEYI